MPVRIARSRTLRTTAPPRRNHTSGTTPTLFMFMAQASRRRELTAPVVDAPGLLCIKLSIDTMSRMVPGYTGATP